MAFLYSKTELRQIAQEALETDMKSGFWKPDPGHPGLPSMNLFIVREKVCLMVCELCEAIEEWRRTPDEHLSRITFAIEGDTSSKPLGFTIEAADFYLRILIFFAALEIDPEEVELIGRKENGRPFMRAAEIIGNLAVVMGTAYPLTPYNRILEERQGSDAENLVKLTVVHLSLALAHMEAMCFDLNVDLKRAISIKMEYNKTRPFRHGGKKA